MYLYTLYTEFHNNYTGQIYRFYYDFSSLYLFKIKKCLNIQKKAKIDYR